MVRFLRIVVISIAAAFLLIIAVEGGGLHKVELDSARARLILVASLLIGWFVDRVYGRIQRPSRGG